MKERIEELLKQVKSLKASNQDELEALRIKYLSKKGEISALFNDFRNVANEEKKEIGKMLNEPKKAIDKNTAASLIYALNAAPHGVLAMSNQIKGLVETSTNLASVKMAEGHKIVVGTSQRSSRASSCNYAAQQVEACFALAGASVKHLNEYPGWQPKLDSHIMEVTKAAYKKLFGKEPVVRAIHAGLECGLFLDKYPDLDMISFGPTLRKVHAPGERLELASLDKFRKLLEQVIMDLK